jgi:hypothetical protein
LAYCQPLRVQGIQARHLDCSLSKERGIILKPIIAIALIGIGLAGCVNTNEMEVAPNVVMLQTNAGGALFAGRSGPEMLKHAAQDTVQRGYTCFALSGAQMKTGSQYAGSIETADANVTGYGYGNSFSAFGSSSGFSTPVYRHVESAGATVTMNNDCGPGSFRAADVLKRSQS